MPLDALITGAQNMKARMAQANVTPLPGDNTSILEVKPIPQLFRSSKGEETVTASVSSERLAPSCMDTRTI